MPAMHGRPEDRAILKRVSRLGMHARLVQLADMLYKGRTEDYVRAHVVNSWGLSVGTAEKYLAKARARAAAMRRYDSVGRL